MKRFDCEDEPNEFMEEPCQCDCGKWFDLKDGYYSETSDYANRHKIVCLGCHKNEINEKFGEEFT